ncbi:MAG: SLC13 family permease [Oscillospiraceae bacterium]
MDIIIIVISILLIGVLCFKNVPTVIGGIVCSLILLVYFQMDLYDGFLTIYMGGFVSFVQKWFLMFFLGAIFGKVMDVSGASDSLARTVLRVVGEKRVSLGICIVSTILISAGISVYITLFIVLPIAIKMCRRANLSRGFIIAGYSLGINIGLALPYVPAANNLLCADYFGTSVGAGGWLSVFCSLVFAVVGMIWITYYENRLAKKGLGYMPAVGEEAVEGEDDDADNIKRPHWILAVIPLIVPILVLNVLKWKVEFALLLGIVAAVAFQFKYIPHKWEPTQKLLVDSINTTMSTVVNTSAIVGFGTVIAATPGYVVAVDKILSINGNPLLVGLLSVTLIAGVAGASSAGLVLAAPVLQQILPLTNAAVFHRTVVFGSLGLDSLPNAGFLQTECTLAGVRFKDVYLPIIFMLTVVMTLGRALLYIALATLLGIA